MQALARPSRPFFDRRRHRGTSFRPAGPTSGTLNHVKSPACTAYPRFFDEPELRARLIDRPTERPEFLKETVGGILGVRLERSGRLYWEVKKNKKGEAEQYEEFVSEIDHLMVDDQGLRLSVHRYAPETWGERLRDWITEPTKWFSEKYDTVTIPFLYLSGVVFGFLLSLVWRYRAHYVEREVKTLIEDLNEAS